MPAPKKPTETDAKPAKDRIDIRLFNTIVIFDVYMAAKTPDAARAGLLSAIASGLEPSEIVAREVTMANSIRASWIDQKPWVADDITDEEFAFLKGNSTMEAYKLLYTKQPK